jgi:diguanylate cyclase
LTVTTYIGGEIVSDKKTNSRASLLRDPVLGEATPADKFLPLVSARDQSEQVQEMVERCASELSSVNDVLRRDVVEGAKPAEVKEAVNLSEEIEVKVQECAEQLAVVNEVLGEEINRRRSLDQVLAATKTALAESWALERSAMQRALHDSVTGLPNLDLFHDRLTVAMMHARRRAQHIAVMFIDLDNFKGINDNHGHDVGDKILQIVSQRLQAAIREGDTVSRRSGDEFLFLMVDAGGENTAKQLAMKIADNISQPSEVDGVRLSVKPSVGIAMSPHHGNTPEELLKNADFAMYAAKRQSAGVAVYDPAMRK